MMLPTKKDAFFASRILFRWFVNPQKSNPNLNKTISIFLQVEKHKAVEMRRAQGGRGRGRSVRGRGGKSNRGRNKPPKDKMAQLAAYFV